MKHLKDLFAEIRANCTNEHLNISELNHKILASEEASVCKAEDRVSGNNHATHSSKVVSMAMVMVSYKYDIGNNPALVPFTHSCRAFTVNWKLYNFT